MKVIKLGILGLGTVGSGTLRILQTNLAEIERRLSHQASLEVVHIAVRDLSKARDVETQSITITDQPLDVVNNPDVDLVVELMGGTTLAKQCLERAIELGKHVVTANKALLAEHGNELFAKAKAQQVMIAYEAAVAGGIPIIKALREGLSANAIEWVAGIINGTGNYILTEMKKPGADFYQVLRTAQELGYAEADPTFDVEGIDAAHKLTLLSSIAFGVPLQFEKVYTEGISKITGEDIQFAEKFGFEIKHLGFASQSEAGVSMRVHPTLIPQSVLLAQVNGVMNAIMVSGDQVGPTLYYGPGAGAGPTASAVVADIIDVVRAMEQDPCARVPELAFDMDSLANVTTLPIDEVECAYYLRFFAKDHAGVLAKVTAVLAEHKISVEHLHQEPSSAQPEDATLVMITNRVKERVLNKAVETLQNMPEIDGDIARIRVESLN